MYTSYKCNTCSGELVLLTDDVKKMAKDRYLVCPYCNSNRIAVDKISDSLKECMSEHSYKRIDGRMQQRR